MKNYKVEDIIETKVTGITEYGIFVSIDENYSGLIHISEISNDFVSDINDYVKMEEIIYCQILEIEEKNKHMKLSIKNINYKSTCDDNSIKESRLGFLPLKNQLQKWMDEKIIEYEGK